MSILSLKQASYSYNAGELSVPVLRGVNLSVNQGEFIAIQGPSGSGKSTLLYLLGGLLKLQSGHLVVEGQDLGAMPEDELCQFRNQRIGFIFQQFHLLPRASVLENIMLPARYPAEAPYSKEDFLKLEVRAKELASLLGISDRLHHHPNQLSGGQQQRVAIARALIKSPSILLADEPTGNLDSVSAAQTLEIFQKLNKEGHTIILITHDAEVASRAGRVLHIRDGKFEGALSSPTDKTQPTIVFDNRANGWMGKIRLAKRLLPDVFRNLGRNRMRTALTMLGIVIGISAVVSLVTLGSFTKRKILESYEELGVNTLLFSGHTNWFQKATDIEGTPFYQFDWERDIEPLRRIFPTILRISPVVSDWKISAYYGGRVVENEVEVLGVNQEAYQMVPNRVLRGRQIVDLDVAAKSAVCLLGADIVNRLFKNEDPLGKVLFLSSGDSRYPCKVIGLLRKKSSNSPRRSPNLELHLPYTYLMLNGRNRWSARLDDVMVQVDPNESLQSVANGMQAYFKNKYGSFGSFNANSDTILVAQMRKFLGLFTLLLASVALVCLTVGGIGITNMMLVSVTERFREIGLRKALGATNRSIRMQFLLEALLICSFAGFIGIILGVVLYEGAIFAASKFATQVKFEWTIDIGAIFLALFSILLVGLLSGLFPALKAERLQVIEALRSE